MGQEQFVVEGALVLCTMGKQPTENGMADVENFKLYRIINLGETNNGVFGLDEAFLNEYDAGAELNIQPFPACLSPYYAEALNDIALHLKELKQSSRDPNEQQRIENRRTLLLQLAEDAVERKKISPENWQVQCVMELLDRWFNCSDTIYVDNFMELLEKLKEELEEIFRVLDLFANQVIEEAKAAMGKGFGEAQAMEWRGELSDPIYKNAREFDLSLPQRNGEREWEPLGIELPKQSEPEGRLDEDEARALMMEYKKLYGTLARRKALEDDLRKKVASINLRYALEVVNKPEAGGTTIQTEKYVDERKGELEQEVKAVWERVKEEAEAVNAEDIKPIISKYHLTAYYQIYQDYINGLFGQIQKLMDRASRINEGLIRKALVTKESYLMCRCGGKIHIIDTGQWVEEADLHIDENIRELLLHAENYVYKLLQKKESIRINR